MHLKNLVITLVICFKFASSDSHQNHVYASTNELQNLQRKFIHFLRRIGHKNVTIVQRLNVEEPIEAFVFLRTLFVDFTKEFARFKKTLIINQVI